MAISIFQECTKGINFYVLANIIRLIRVLGRIIQPIHHLPFLKGEGRTLGIPLTLCHQMADRLAKLEVVILGFALNHKDFLEDKQFAKILTAHSKVGNRSLRKQVLTLTQRRTFEEAIAVSITNFTL